MLRFVHLKIVFMMFSKNNKLVELLLYNRGFSIGFFKHIFLPSYSNTNFPLTAALCDYVVQHSWLNHVYLCPSLWVACSVLCKIFVLP